jgi:hypothetical protein
MREKTLDTRSSTVQRSEKRKDNLMPPPYALFDSAVLQPRAKTFGLRVSLTEERAIRALAARLNIRPADAVRSAIVAMIALNPAKPRPPRGA